MARFTLTAVGADRPGIVAAVTEVLADLGCNLEDSSMTILGGQFAMMLVLSTPPEVGATDLEAATAGPAGALGLVVTVREAADEEGPPPAGEGAWTVSVHGADHPGIVHGVAALLAAEGVNIVDLSTRVAGPAEAPLYAMVLDVTLPPTVEPDGLQRRLQARAVELGVTCHLHPAETDIL